MTLQKGQPEFETRYDLFATVLVEPVSPGFKLGLTRLLLL
jgi:hypothetical protein